VPNANIVDTITGYYGRTKCKEASDWIWNSENHELECNAFSSEVR